MHSGMEDTDPSLTSSTMASDNEVVQNTDYNTASADQQHATFLPAWTANDASHFAPANLPVPRIQRAWDRKPQSPFSRKKVRFGKVWKRSNTSGMNPQGTGVFGVLDSLTASGDESPARAVKKMRVGEDGSQSVRDWEGRGSPANRRIVTRSNISAEPLLELGDEEECPEQPRNGDEEEYVSRVEVSYEDGRVEEIDVQEELAQDEWEDESATEEDVDGWERLRMSQEFSAANIASTPEAQSSASEGSAPPEGKSSPEQLQTQSDGPECSSTTKRTSLSSAQHEVASPDVDLEQPLEEKPEPLIRRISIELGPDTLSANPIPEGFVSPMKGRKRPISKVRQQAYTNRRKTLPVNFTTESARVSYAQTIDAQDPEGPLSTPATDVVTRDDDLQRGDVTHTQATGGIEPTKNAEEQASQQDMSTQASNYNRASTPENQTIEEWVPTVENTPTSPPANEDDITLQINPTITALAESQLSPSKLPSIPVGSITGAHPRLPLRRSPRRQSSTPLKRSYKDPVRDRSHLIAFTPIRYPTSSVLAGQNADDSSPLPTSPRIYLDSGNVKEAMPQPIRSSSAPPEEPQMSPRKPFEPRMSDDTATLQAFIKRAAESKSGKRVSVSKRESIDNIRNSETVRQALASPGMMPAPKDVLADLDPNSPSPRKQPGADLPRSNSAVVPDDETPSSPGKTSSRRSGRSKKKPDTLPASTYTGPTKISLRGNTDSVVLKKTEAQELATLTRTNTRKNKGLAVLPLARLTKLAEESNERDGESAEIEADVTQRGRKAVTWSETLLSFYQGDAEPDTTIMTDELQGPDPGSDATNTSNALQSTDTPSKPRLRRLKPPRTASTPAKIAPREETAAQTEEKAEDTKQPAKPTTKRRTRIATPAKLYGASLLPDGLERERDLPTKANVTKKKIVSKLPAPTPISTILAQGKENSLIASPPKKKVKASETTDVPSFKAFAPKLDLVKPLTTSNKKGSELGDNIPGMASPAKKVVRSSLFGNNDDNGTFRAGKEELPPSLASPAKKRTRRAVG